MNKALVVILLLTLLGCGETKTYDSSGRPLLLVELQELEETFPCLDGNDIYLLKCNFYSDSSRPNVHCFWKCGDLGKYYEGSSEK